MQSFFDHLGKLTALLLTLAAGLSWWLAPGPPAWQLPQGQEATATRPAKAPSRVEKSTDKSVAAIVAANLWGTVQSAAAESLIAPEWRFSGIAVNGQEKLVMITIEGQPAQVLKVRDQLPGGATILRIDDDHLCLLVKGKKRKLDLF